jgi:LuxR family maltose regulon positive regulatory protein
MLDETTARIIMLVAPAGYGKTTLAREWLAERNRRFAWYQADASSRDIAAFALGIRDAVRQIIPAAGDSIEASLRASASPEADAHRLATLLAEDLADWPADSWLVIDDYQLAAASDACELFVDTLTESSLRLIVLSRKRPTWATPRRRLYGELFEVDGSSLTLSSSEAAAILRDHPLAEASRLVQTAEGWPAIIGLAAFAPSSAAADISRLPTELYDYLAEELYKAASPALRQAISLLSVAPTVTPDLSSRLLGEDYDALFSEGIASGFLSSHGDSVSMHPLLRDFLRQRLELRREDRRAIIRRVADALIFLDHWDDAFLVVSDLPAPDLLDGLIVRSLSKLLDSNRLSTISHWTSWARRSGHASPVVQTAEAEVDLRRGLHARAEATARDVLRAIDAAHPFAARAHLIAARAANFLSRSAEAYEHAHEAYNSAMDARTRSDAAWSRLSIAFELEREDLDELLADVLEAPSDSHVQTIRILNGRALLHSLSGSLADALVPSHQVIALASEIDDPMVRTSFYSRQATVLQASGWYDDASIIADAEVAYARRARVDFVMPYAMLLRGAIEFGRRQFDISDDMLATATRLAPSDPYVKMHAAHVRARLMLARHEFDAAAAITGHRPASPPGHAFFGEYLGTHAVALACLRRFDRALAVADHVEQITRIYEGRCLAAAARALVAFYRGDTSAPLGLLSFIEERGCFDAFVTAYRAEPRLLDSIFAAEMSDRIRRVLERAHDTHLFEQARVGGAEGELQSLTRRQREVVRLLAAGLSNREIAQRLVISEVTVKVHLRNIFARMNVRSRTEAAVKAALLIAKHLDR